MNSLVRFPYTILKSLLRAFSLTFLLGLSLLPLSVLLLTLPAIFPDESPLKHSVSRKRSLFANILARLFALVSGFTVLVALVAIGTEIVSRFHLHAGSNFESIYGIFGAFGPGTGDRLMRNLPEAIVKFWPHVVLVVYALDLAILCFIGKVPLQYNVRNLLVRWRTTGMTALAFTVVTALLTVMLAFVNGMNVLTESSGIPGNVFVLSDGSNDEVMSTLGYGDIKSINNERVTVGENDRPVKNPINIEEMELDGLKVPMVSLETFFVVNQTIKLPDGRIGEGRRFIQCRGIENSAIAAAVHNISLLPGGRWFSEAGSVEGVIEVVMGEGVAGTMGADQGKPSLQVGDRFELADKQFVIVGIMSAEGSTFGSEIWGKRNNLGPAFGKDSISTVVMRVADGTDVSARKMAYHLRNRFKTPKVSAKSEPEYYAELNKTNKQFLGGIILVAIIMAIGGVFGVMNTMFAAIAQRSRDIGVLRILGFRRWQILVSFMIETLAIALLGGLVGLFFGSLVDGLSATSILSGGMGGGGKTVVLRLTVDGDVWVTALLFAVVMGRVGGLVPALSAMRVSILDSLR